MSAAGDRAARAERPSLPPAYDLVALDVVDDVLEEGRRRALEGAAEGTLLWARRQRAAIVGGGREAEVGDLLCALVLRPELEVEEVAQLAVLGAVAARCALAAVVPPLTTVHCTWSGSLLVEGVAAGCVRLLPATAGEGRVEWAVLGFGAQLVEPPKRPRPRASAHTSLHAVGADAEPLPLLEAYARHLLGWLDRWSTEGFAPVCRRWNGYLLPAAAPGERAGPSYALEESGSVVATARRKGRTTSWRVSLVEALGIAPPSSS